MKTLPRLTIFLLLAVLLAGCNLQAADQPISASVVEAMGGGDEAGFARAVAPLTFSFPRDHGPHPDYRTEWWYYTGNLSADDGTLYGYQLTFFRSALTPEMPARA
ncbi:MAG: carotenoid 1,2-hydratase, partial [Caldilinea sp.]|nr:carotenoid 1,2-hydratase [Caldilinea sp.]